MGCNNARAKSGKVALIQIGTCTVLTATKWSCNIGSDPEPYFAIDGCGWSQTVAKGFQGDGSLDVVVSDDALVGELAASGNLVTITLLDDTGGANATGKARLGKFNYQTDRAGMPQTMTIPFITDGPWSGDLLGDMVSPYSGTEVEAE